LPFSFLFGETDTEAEKQKFIFEVANTISWDNYFLTGLTAWDRLSITSIQTKMSLSGTFPGSEDKYFSFILGVRRPVVASIYQLDQVDSTLDTGTSSFFYGAYNLWAYNQRWQKDRLQYGFFAGPAIDYYYQDTDYLLSIGWNWANISTQVLK